MPEMISILSNSGNIRTVLNAIPSPFKYSFPFSCFRYLSVVLPLPSQQVVYYSRMLPLKQINITKKKINKITMEKAVVIIIVMRDIHPNHDLLKEVSRQLQ